MTSRFVEYMRQLGKDIVRDRYLYLLLIPFVAFFLIFTYKPMYGLQIAFKDYSLFKGITASPWIGFENFRVFFKSPHFIRVLKNTLMINLYGLVFGFPIPIILALLFNEVKNDKFKRVAQTLTYLPHFVSVVVVAGLVVNFLAPTHGMVNHIIEALGGERVYFLIKPEYFRTIFTGMNIWKETGFGAVIYIAALAGVDPQLYEAAVVDGATKWKQMIHVTIPGILPTVTIMLILRIGKMLEVGYEAILLLYQPATYQTADVISTYVYRAAMEQGNYAMATAVELFNAIIAIILVYGANKFSKKFSETSLW
ncbi:MAG: sugar ABC transporter permease [Epulopiscium sp.]|nr:sugar ABC transporter permease [Candidatus Epulonipiscium sp.]